MKESADRYLAFRAQVRLARQEAIVLPDLVARLSDVRRKLDVLQEADNANVLARDRRTQQEQGAWNAVCDSVRDAIDAVRSSTDDLVVVDLGIETNNTKDLLDTEVNQMHKSLYDIIVHLRRQIQDSIENAENEIEKLRSDPATLRWQKTVLSNRQSLEAVLQNLSDQGIGGFEDYQELLAEAAKLNRDIDSKGEQETHSAKLEEQANEALEEYRELRRKLADHRQAYAADASSETVKLDIRPLFDNTSLQDTLVKHLKHGSFRQRS